jgi:hypothetical protein
MSFPSRLRPVLAIGGLALLGLLPHCSSSPPSKSVPTDGRTPVEAGAAASGNQISQYGVTWTFSEDVTFGQFVNGDYWVVGPVTIAEISPDMTTSGGRTMNGWDVDPLPSNAQGYDSCAGDYDATDVPALPYVAKPGSSVVKAVSATNPPGGAGQPICLQTAAVLTVVGEPPPDNGATVFRPPYVGTKPVPLTYSSVNDVQWSLLPSLTPNNAVSAFEPDLASIPGRLGRVQLDHLNDRTLNVEVYIYNGVPNAEINPVDNMQAYGPARHRSGEQRRHSPAYVG